jgi:hypothetical protein
MPRIRVSVWDHPEDRSIRNRTVRTINVQVASLRIVWESDALREGGPPVQFHVFRDTDDGTILDLTGHPSLIWSSNNEQIATVDQSGVVTPVARGEILISAEVQ